MTIYLNREPVALPDGATVADALASEGIPTQGTAVAIGNRVVPRAQWEEHVLEDETYLTVIRAVCGG